MKPKSGQIRIGLSGWRYKPWRGGFYPKGLPQRAELEFAAKTFSTVEINGTFYSLQRPSSFETWASQTPAGFRFAVKGPRYITHMRRLRDIHKPLANFFVSGVLLLGGKLGPILWQFPPNFRFDAAKMEAFFKLLPRDTVAARSLAKKHEKWMGKRVSLGDTKVRQKLRHAVEIRHESFLGPEFLRLLRKHDVALVCADSVEWPRVTDVTSDFVYCRLHGSEELYVSGYDAKSLDEWAGWIRAWSRGGSPATGRIGKTKRKFRRYPRDVYVYFDNDAKVRAPADARALIQRLSRALRLAS